ncbi:hypothetical protein [Nostoc phage YongM]|nr:hypothetical protein [Nostoc phage YongM]
MQTVFLGTCWDSVKSIDILAQAGYNIEKETKGVIKLEHLLPEEQYILSGLCGLLDLKYGEDLTNAGLAIFNDDWQYIYFTYPCVGIGEKDQLGLMIGASNATEKAAFLPMVYTPAKNEDESGDYHLVTPKGRKIKVGLTSIPGSDNRTRHYLMIKNKNFIFNIPFKAVNDELATGYVNSCFDDGTFHECCKSFLKSGVKFSTMFKKAFLDGYFPENGVILVLAKGKISESEQYGRSSIWEVVSSSHPNLIVLDSAKETPGEMELKEAGTIFCSNACSASKHLFAGKSGQDPYIIWVKARNPNNINHLPLHDGYQIALVPPKFKAKFPAMLEQAKQIALGNFSANMKALNSVEAEDTALADF